MTAVSPELWVWLALAGEVDAGRDAALAVVVASVGHSPGRPGFVMAVGREGWLAGTTGGGAAEEFVVTEARTLLAGAASVGLFTQTHVEGVASASGLVCGGEQRVALVRMGRGQGDEVAALIASLSAGERVGWAVGPDGWRPGPGMGGFVADADGWRFAWQSGPRHHVYIVGAGHVGVALARTLIPLGFRVSVIDERPGAVERVRGLAHQTSTRRYEELSSVVSPGPETFVLIAAHAPARDLAAVEAVSGLGLGYLGVLGSRRKVDHLGLGSSVHAPMGLPIGSHTPDEIAVSVAAELVQIAERVLTPDARRTPGQAV